MALNVNKLPKTKSSSSKPRSEALDAGSYPGRVVHIIDLGLQPQRPYKGTEKPPAYCVRLVYELADEFMLDEDGNEDEDKPRWVAEDFPMYSLEVENAKSTQRYNALDPKSEYEGDFAKLVECPCNITLIQNEGKGANAGKVYNNVSGVTPMRAKAIASAPELANPPIVFSLDEPDLEVFEGFPDFLQDKIKGNLEFAGSPLEALLKGDKPKPKVEKEEEDDEDLPDNDSDESEDEGDDDDW